MNSQQLNKLPAWLVILASAGLLLAVWQLIVAVGGYDHFILPPPAAVWRQFVLTMQDGRLPAHTLTTFSEVLPGLLLGLLAAAPLGYLLAKSPLAERLLSPYLVASQAIPIIAIAPLLAIWMRSVYWSRTLVAMLVVFFPILINITAGLRAIPTELQELMASLKATRWQRFVKLELPAALPVTLAGLKVGATLSVIGALVGEFVQPKSAGLGFLLLTARYQFKTDLVFVVLAVLGGMALILYGGVSWLEKRLLRWQDAGKR